MTQYNTNNSLEQKSLWNFLKKYKKVSIALICIPILLSAACYFSVPYFNQAGSSAWLSFWGGYLGSVIMAGVTLHVLEQQLSQNHNVNVQNRNNNKVENKSNRELQLNILLFQQEQQWLDKFRQVAVNYLEIYSYNDLVDVSNIARKDPYKAFYMVKDLFSRAGKADLELSFIQRNSELFNKIDTDKTLLFIFYNEVLGDIQSLLSIRIDDENATLSDRFQSLSDITEDMRNIIIQILKELPDDSIENQFNTAILTRIKLVKNCEDKLRDWFCEYIKEEQYRINNILNFVNGTTQDK